MRCPPREVSMSDGQVRSITILPFCLLGLRDTRIGDDSRLTGAPESPSTFNFASSASISAKRAFKRSCKEMSRLKLGKNKGKGWVFSLSSSRAPRLPERGSGVFWPAWLRFSHRRGVTWAGGLTLWKLGSVVASNPVLLSHCLEVLVWVWLLVGYLVSDELEWSLELVGELKDNEEQDWV